MILCERIVCTCYPLAMLANNCTHVAVGSHTVAANHPHVSLSSIAHKLLLIVSTHRGMTRLINSVCVQTGLFLDAWTGKPVSGLKACSLV